MLVERRTKSIDIFRFERHARCHRVAPEGFEILATGLDGFENIEAGDATGRAFGDTIFDREDDGRAVKAINDAAGHDADNAAVPVFSRKDNPTMIG